MITNMSVASGFAVGFGLITLWLFFTILGTIGSMEEEESYRKRGEIGLGVSLMVFGLVLLSMAFASTVTGMLVTHDVMERHNVCKAK